MGLFLAEEESKRLDEVNSQLKSIEEEGISPCALFILVAKAKKEAPHEKLHWTPLMVFCQRFAHDSIDRLLGLKVL